jgi:hypothetical protein
MEEEKKEKGFVIKDKRLFSETGEVRKEALEEKKEEKPDDAAIKKEAAPEEESEDETRSAYLPEVNFSNFILSLSTTAMYHFGDFPDPATNKAVRNLPAAKHTIDTIGMLQGKTSGNLDENEKNLLDGLLFELRMRFVKEAGPK